MDLPPREIQLFFTALQRYELINILYPRIGPEAFMPPQTWLVLDLEL
jgi:hypothetical protein